MTIEYAKWWMDHSKLVAYGRHLHFMHDMGPRELLYYFEKPWKWEAEGSTYNIKNDQCKTCPKE